MPQKSYTLGNLLQDCLDCDIRKSDIRQFFDDLKKKAHFVYAILCGAPKSVFWITLDDEESHPDEKTFSVAEFNDNYENFDSRIDSFRVNFNAYFFREQWATKFPEWELMENPFNGEERFCATSRKELTVEIFVTEYPHLLAYLCRRAVLETPARLYCKQQPTDHRRVARGIRAAESHRLPAGSASKKAGAEA